MSARATFTTSASSGKFRKGLPPGPQDQSTNPEGPKFSLTITLKPSFFLDKEPNYSSVIREEHREDMNQIRPGEGERVTRCEQLSMDHKPENNLRLKYVLKLKYLLVPLLTPQWVGTP